MVSVGHARFRALGHDVAYYGNLILWFLSHGYWHIYFMCVTIISFILAVKWGMQAEKGKEL